MIVQPCFTLTSYLYNICICLQVIQLETLTNPSPQRSSQRSPSCSSWWLVYTSSARFNIQRNFISNMSSSSEVLGLKEKKKAEDPWFKLLVCISAILNWKWESEQEDMNPERQRDVRVRDVDVNRQSDEPVVFVWNTSRTGSVSSGQTLRFDSKQTQLFFCFFFYPLAPKLKKQNHRGGEVDRNLRCRGLRFGRFADPCRRLSDCFVSNWFL